MKLELEVQNAVDGSVSPALFERWVTAALQARGDAVEVVIRVVDEAEGRTLNQVWRGHDKATNVLSFPADLPAELDVPLLGDIVLCAPVVAREAQEQHKELLDHYAHLTVHGVLHLLGLDHEDDEQAMVMETLEREVLASLGIDDPYRVRED